MNGRERTGSHNIDVLAALLLLCAFAMCILSVLMAGTKSYRSLTARDQAAFERTSRALYVSTRIRRAESRGAVSCAEENGFDTIRLTEIIGGEEYVTRIYCCDGWIRELFSRSDLKFDPKAGEKVSEAASFEVTESGADGRIMTVVIDGGTDEAETLYFSLQEGEG